MTITYEKIFKEAIEVMNQNGYSGTSVQMIAEKANVSKSTVIHYFKSKEGILLTILENFLPPLIVEFNKVLNDHRLGGVEMLRRFIGFHLNVIAESGNILTLNIREARYLSHESRSLIEKYQREYEYIIVKIIDKIKYENNELFRNLDTIVVAKAIMGICNSPTIWYKKEGEMEIMEIASLVFELLIPGDNYSPANEVRMLNTGLTTSSL